MTKNNMRHIIGLADSCELLSAVFAFPTRELAEALSDGALAQDAQSCLLDMGADEEVVECAQKSLALFEGLDAQELFETLRKGNSILYLTPGGEVPVWPYESGFRYIAEGREGTPSLFRSPKQIDAERHMKQAGVLPKKARTEPADSIWSELSFMSYLYANLGNAMQEDREEDIAVWSSRIVSFWDEHASLWMSAFMDKTQQEAPRCSFGIEYVALADLGKLMLGVIAFDIETRKNRG